MSKLPTSHDVNIPSLNLLPGQSSCSSEIVSKFSQLPKNEMMTINLGLVVKSIKFHPLEQLLLLVGTNTGEIMIWNLGKQVKLVEKKFEVRDITSRTLPLQVSMSRDKTASVNRVDWSPEGTLLGVAYSKSFVHTYAYLGGGVIQMRLEIEAHRGSVNDLVFTSLNTLVTCGDDMKIKVWNATTGGYQYNFLGHEAPGYSVCPRFMENNEAIISSAIDGKIKVWQCNDMGSSVDYDSPGRSSTKITQNADRTRLFLSGTNNEGYSYIVEWNESDGTVKRTYNGLGKRPIGGVTTNNRFIAAGDKGLVKFWDMDNSDLSTMVDVYTGDNIPASPFVCFNNRGTLLAVSTNDHKGIKILANPDGVWLLKTAKNCYYDAFRTATEPYVKVFGATVFVPASGSNGPALN